jgi:hypothetical protein
VLASLVVGSAAWGQRVRVWRRAGQRARLLFWRVERLIRRVGYGIDGRIGLHDRLLWTGRTPADSIATVIPANGARSALPHPCATM